MISEPILLWLERQRERLRERAGILKGSVSRSDSVGYRELTERDRCHCGCGRSIPDEYDHVWFMR